VTESPYVGLDFFAEDKAQLFYGRDSERNTIIGNLRASRLTLLYAESGVGKSSLLRAGVSARLQEIARESADEGESPEFIPVVFSSWLDDPLSALVRELESATRPFLSNRKGLELPRDRLEDAIEATSKALDTTPLLILDQFEEFFLYHRDDEAGERFADELAKCVARADLRGNFLISIREDAYSRIGDRFSGRIPNVYSNYLHLDYLDGRSAEAAIREPIRWLNGRSEHGEARYTIADDLVDTVLDQVRRDRHHVADGNSVGRFETAYLQLVMERLWHAEVATGTRQLRLETLKRLGGGSTILQRHLGDAMDTLPPDERQAAAEALRYLVTSGGTKIALTAPELADYTQIEPPRLERALARLGRERILRPDSSGEALRYELYHDMLGDAVVEWRKGAEQEREKAQLRDELEAEAERKRHRLTIRALWALGVLVVLLAVTTYVALVERRRAEQAEETARSRALAASAVSQLGQDPELSVMLARAAMQARATSEADDALRRALATSAVRGRFNVGPTVSAAFDDATGRLATVGPREISLWDSRGASRLVLRQALRADSGAFAMGRDGAVVAIDDDRETLVLRARANPQRVALEHGGGLTWVALSADQAYAAGARRGKIVVWNARTGRELARFPDSGFAEAGAFDPQDPKRLLTADCARGAVRIVRWESGESRTRGSAPRAAPVTGSDCLISVSPDGQRAVYSLKTGSARLWDVERDRVLVRRLPGIHDSVRDFGWSSDGRRFAVAAGRSASIFAARDGGRVSTTQSQPDELNSVAFSRSGLFLVTTSDDATARVADVATGSQIATLHGHQSPVLDATFGRYGRDVVTVSTDGSARLWRLPTGGILRGHRDRVLAAQFIRQGRSVVTGGADGRLLIWDRRTRHRVHVKLEPSLPAAPVNSVAADITGGHFLVARSYSSWTGQVLLVDANSGQIERHREVVPAAKTVALSPDGKLFVTTSTSVEPKLWRLDGRPPVATLRLTRWQRALSAAFSPDGRWIVTAGVDGVARIFDSRTLTPGVTLRRRGALYGAVFSPDGRRVLSFGADGTAQIWHFRPRRQDPLVLRGHTSWIGAGAFSPDGRQVVTGSADRTTRVWDARSGELLSTHNMHSDIVNSVAFSPDGKTILSAGDDRTARLYPCQTCRSDAELMQLAKRRIFRGFTPDERREYVELLNQP
jgi:WD40 repeat protein